jgi:putative effector of murein hydrolase LrgA (UPF0299 family)
LSLPTAPDWDRFAQWRPWPARLALLALLLLLAAAAFAPIRGGKTTVKTQGFVENVAGAKGAERKRDDDLALYDVAIARIGKGENYYDFIAEEHRKAQYPVRPGLAVRLPTLAYFDAWVGVPGQIVAALALLAATMLAWWRRLGEEPGGREKRVLAMAFLFVGTSLGLNRYFFVLHELWSGMLLALAFGLHRLGRKWGWALVAAALAVAIREHALPFILLMAAMAFWRRNWKEGVAWSALALLFLSFLAWHLSIVAGLAQPGDRIGASWMAFRGLSGWLSNVALSSNLRYLPHWLAGPTLILMVFGWTGWKSPAAIYGTLLYLGYGLAFMIAGRPDNYYWGAMVAPAMFLGLAFVPQAMTSLIRAAFPK